MTQLGYAPSVLVIDHDSKYIDRLRESMDKRGVCSLRKDYRELAGMNAGSFDGVISIGERGYLHPREAIEKDEARIWGECERGSTPMLGINNAGLVGIVQSSGFISLMPSAREGVFQDYQVKKEDAILKGIDKDDKEHAALSAYEKHRMGIDAPGIEYDILLIDNSTKFNGGKGRPQVARHKSSKVYIVQFNPLVSVNGTNGNVIIENFLAMIK